MHFVPVIVYILVIVFLPIVKHLKKKYIYNINKGPPTKNKHIDTVIARTIENEIKQIPQLTL